MSNYQKIPQDKYDKAKGQFRLIYDECKADIAIKHPDYTKLHIHNAALNRTATFLAKEIYQTLRE